MIGIDALYYIPCGEILLSNCVVMTLDLNRVTIIGRCASDLDVKKIEST